MKWGLRCSEELNTIVSISPEHYDLPFPALCVRLKPLCAFMISPQAYGRHTVLCPRQYGDIAWKFCLCRRLQCCVRSHSNFVAGAQYGAKETPEPQRTYYTSNKEEVPTRYRKGKIRSPGPWKITLAATSISASRACTFSQRQREGKARRK